MLRFVPCFRFLSLCLRSACERAAHATHPWSTTGHTTLSRHRLEGTSAGAPVDTIDLADPGRNYSTVCFGAAAVAADGGGGSGVVAQVMDIISAAERGSGARL